MSEYDFTSFLLHSYFDWRFGWESPHVERAITGYCTVQCPANVIDDAWWDVGVLAWQEQVAPCPDAADNTYSLVLRRDTPYDHGGLLIGSMPAAQASRTVDMHGEWLRVPGALVGHYALVAPERGLIKVRLGTLLLKGQFTYPASANITEVKNSLSGTLDL